MIHTVGPVWSGGGAGEAALLASCYRASLQLAVAHGLKSVAFPAISCGIYGYPLDQAAEVAVNTVAGFLKDDAPLDRVVLVCFGDEVLAAYREALRQVEG